MQPTKSLTAPVGMWMQVRGGSYERGLLEIEHGLDALSSGRFVQLMVAIGEKDPLPPAGVPVWNRTTCTLCLNGKLIRKIRGVSSARNIVLILDVFQESYWPDRIDDPLKPSESGNRLREAIRTLNTGLKLIHFRGDGSEGIIWERK